MERILTYTIPVKAENQKISSFLKAQGYSSQNLIELKKMPESVLVNGTWTYLNQRLHTGDELTIHIREEASSEKIPPVALPIDILYEDEDLMVINKPAGMPIHPSMNNYENSLGNALAYYFASQKKPFIFRCINRLDRDTSGLTIVAKHMVSAGMLSAMVAQKSEDNRNDKVNSTNHTGITREYLAITRGSVNPPAGTITAPLSRKSGSILERQVDFEHGETAVTHYRKIDEKNGHSLVSLVLETGRTHQIRVHMKYLGFPLIGDYLYHPDMELINRQALHSYRLRFTHPITHEEMEFTAPLPDDMMQVAGEIPWQY